MIMSVFLTQIQDAISQGDNYISTSITTLALRVWAATCGPLGDFGGVISTS